MPIRAERQTAHTGSPPADAIYLISAQDGLYGKEPFSVYLRSEEVGLPEGGPLHSVYTERNCFPYRRTPRLEPQRRWRGNGVFRGVFRIPPIR